MKLTINHDLEKYGYSGYSIGFDARSHFSSPDGSWSEKIIIFGVDNGSYVHIDSKNNNILVLGKGPTQGLNDAAITAEATQSQSGKKLC